MPPAMTQQTPEAEEFMEYEYKKPYKPIPVQAILDTIAEILVRGTGQEFDLEIYESPYYNDESYNAVTIELKFKVPAPTK